VSEPISGPVAHQIRSLNEMAAINLAGSMILSMIAKAPSDPPGERVLKGLHQIFTFMLLEIPGQYRECEALLLETNEDTGLTTLARRAPEHSDVAGLMAKFFEVLAAMWPSADALDIAAFALWTILWVHPFMDGNGRAARAFAYVCLSVKAGRLLPGAETFFAPMLRKGLCAIVHRAIVTFEDGSLDLSEMRSYLDALVKLQAHVARREVTV
jgi:Fic/DOC family